MKEQPNENEEKIMAHEEKNHQLWNKMKKGINIFLRTCIKRKTHWNKLLVIRMS